MRLKEIEKMGVWKDTIWAQLGKILKNLMATKTGINFIKFSMVVHEVLTGPSNSNFWIFNFQRKDNIDKKYNRKRKSRRCLC